ncbi:L-seryl-tRNA(Ser) seleniumtransferase [Streptomyces sp. Ncost-T6T-1]|uniref:beta-eliminating lyase-related protein n=1 Tax=Streptomyces sp. Ncost-T6T-1 TaxID=1100828 RepID=UPI000805BC52|nr:beta-eliminating lyase-related protein [Streptomyces sp. Ncost-T6T-1]SBU94072.1 L-seryl-tRNA(Ser) seleniumtransferase [Streptomyces sp. Ncost-T6T-1]
MQYKDLDVTHVVSAQANTTPLGGCTLSDGVVEAMSEAAKWHVDIDKLWDAAGARFAEVTGTEDACPTTGASAGVAISVAAIIAGTDVSRIQSLPGAVDGPNEVLLQKGHSISYSGAPIGQMIAIGGGRVKEVGAVNETLPAHIEGAITERTAALMFVTSHTHATQRRSVPLEEVIAIGRRHNIPVIVDAANEEDLKHWSALGADLVCYSGPKSLGAPTSGFVCGSRQLIAACRAQYSGIARPMKVGKESLMGLLQAVDEYVAVTPQARGAQQRARMEALAPRLDALTGLTARVMKDESGREIYRVLLTVDPQEAGRDAATLAKEAQAGTPAVYLRDFKMHLGQLEVDPRALSAAGEEDVVRCLTELLTTSDARS